MTLLNSNHDIETRIDRPANHAQATDQLNARNRELKAAIANLHGMAERALERERAANDAGDVDTAREENSRALRLMAEAKPYEDERDEIARLARR